MKKLIKYIFFVLCIGLTTIVFIKTKTPSPIATLTFTGNTSIEVIEWKNPTLPLQKASFPSYEVLFSCSSKETLSSFFWGDLIGIRYKLIKWRSFFHWIGCKDFIEIEALGNDYTNIDAKQKFPSKIIPLEEKHAAKWMSWTKSLWKKLFFDLSHNLFFSQASLHLQYFPLNGEKRSFVLWLEEGSLTTH